MRAEILSIGTELLLGQITDTNAVYLSQRLAELGISVFFRSTVGDNPERLASVIRLAKERADVIICTGGLGPTEDDITSAGIAEVFDAPLEMDAESQAEIARFFARRELPMTAKQDKQAMFPRGAIVIPNPTGTAPGFILEQDGKIVMAFPGPPQEMHPMWRATAEPFLRVRSGETIVSRTLRFCGIGEGALETELQDLIDQQTTTTVAPYAKQGEVHIRLTAKAPTVEDVEQLIAPVEAEIRRRVGKYLYGIDDDALEVVIGSLLREQGLRLAVAESCTGGLLGERLSSVPGSSDYFAGGVISYSNEVKRILLGVQPETLGSFGAVSEQTACEMAEGVVFATNADIGISITGIAGPSGGSVEKPVGLVYIGVARKSEPARALRFFSGGNREMIRYRASQQALVLLRDVLTGAGVTTW